MALKKYDFIVYMVVFSLLIVVFYLVNVFADGEYLRSVFYYVQFGEGAPVIDALSDFFDSVRAVVRDPYTDSQTIYPPMANLIYRVALHLSPDHLWGIDGRLYMHQMLIYIIISVFSLWLITTAADTMIEPMPLAIRRWVYLLFFFSSPVLFALERGNIVLLVVGLSMYFLAMYNNDNAAVREIALVSLAVAISIKIYPAVYGIVLLKNKKYNMIFRMGIYSLLGFILPSFAFGGPRSITVWISNLSSFSSGAVYEWGNGYNLSPYAIFAEWFDLLGFDVNFHILNMIIRCSVLMVFAATFLCKDEWHQILGASLLIIIVPSLSFYYVVTFLWIAFIVYIRDCTDGIRFTNKKWFPVLFLILCVPWLLPLSPLVNWVYVVSWSFFVYGGALILLMLCVIIEMISGFICLRYAGKK